MQFLGENTLLLDCNKKEAFNQKAKIPNSGFTPKENQTKEMIDKIFSACVFKYNLIYKFVLFIFSIIEKIPLSRFKEM